jgi:hypothetical protein
MGSDFQKALRVESVVASPALMAAPETHRPTRPALIAAIGIAFGLVGCPPHEYVMIQTGNFPSPFIYSDTLKYSREGSAQIQTFHDYETARNAAYAGIGQLEGLHYLVPDDENGLYLLNRSWVGIAFGFIDDDREAALEAKDDVMAEYHAARGRAACKRARYYGEQLVKQHADGFETATRNAETLKAWLVENYDDPEQADPLFWLGFSIVGTVTFDRENPAAVGELWVGVEILEHVLRLDETIERGMAHTVLGAYHARSAMAELDDAKKHLDRSIAIHGGKLLSTQVTLAQSYYCMKRDKTNYMKTLNAVVSSGDPLPEARLPNAVALRKARRYLHNKLFQEECGFEG